MKCRTTNKKYIGQTRSHKLTRGKYYKYGIDSRFKEHISASRRRNTPLCQAIKEHGGDTFKIKVLEQCCFEDASEREMYYINKFDTLVPNGYNKQKYSRTYKKPVEVCPTKTNSKCRISGVRKNGVLTSARIYLYSHEGTKRINFNRSDQTFEENLERAKEYASQLSDNITIDNVIQTPTFEEHYQTKIDSCADYEIGSVILAPTGNLARVCIYEVDGTKCVKTITFGGKHSSLKENVENALKFVECIGVNKDKITNNITQSP
jgi:group I intron endonuclease